MLRQGQYEPDGFGGASTPASRRVVPAPGRIERLLFRPVPLWSLILFALLATLGAGAFGAIVDGWERAGMLGRVAIRIARTPDTIHAMLRGTAPIYAGAAERSPAGFWRDPGTAFEDPGYALISPFDLKRGRSVVRLMRLSDGAALREIVPDVDAVNARSRFRSALVDPRRDKDASRNRLMHPLLLEDGSVVLHDSSPLARYDACGRMIWSIDGIFTHSTERAADGNLWVPYRYPQPREPGVKPDFWDDAVAEVSPDGRMLRTERVAEILERNGLAYLWRGRPYSDDPFHLNDIQPVLITGRYWRRGDVFLSLRNLSLVALYRPSTGKILWWRSGPWRFQHDVSIVDDHRISVFDNNVLLGYPDERVNGTNRLLVFDLASGAASSPYAQGFARNHIATRAQGRGTPLPGGDLMVEETEQGRLMRMAPDGTLRWRYISATPDLRRMALSWARYLSPATDGRAIQAAVSAKCV
ncbi:hypothetical protein IAG41_11245 [Sphingomonas sp. JC676]|uniref:arylsulfotransferase family protein n=1 Tax=Sphingomonas sp. JC676 TaxID=2768065 RepID=UPI001657F0BF|nr:arylsulfotransferase family protein [Sphingomonas sp. JC676]MBC9032970.1 hypothetical protein [Sphingomonas sp. JC676]